MDIIDELAESNVRRNLVVAAAGSGKTPTLINVVARRIAKGSRTRIPSKGPE